MADNYPVNKNSALFKKFIQNRNKSHSAITPSITDIKVTLKENNIDEANESFEERHNKTVNANRQNQQNYDHIQASKSKEKEYMRGILNTKAEQYNIYQYKTVERTEKVESEVIESPKFKTGKTFENSNQLKQQIEHEEGKKYRKLLSDYEELKETLLQERKKHLKDHYILQEELEAFKKKNFQVRMHEDELIHENNKLKEKLTLEAKSKVSLQEENKELGYKIQEMEDMFEGKENAIKKRGEEAEYWKNLSHNMREEMNNLNAVNQRLGDQCHNLQRQMQNSKKQKGNKDLHLNEMREKINDLIHENSMLKDQIYHITSRLYQFEQENQSLKADLKRDNERFPMSYLQEQIAKKPQFYNPHTQTHHQKTQYSDRKEIPTENEGRRNQRKRGEFAKERGNKTFTQRTQTKQERNMSGDKKVRVFEKKERLGYLQKELQKIADMRAINGSLRRQKITYEREMLEIEQFLKEAGEL